MERTASKTALLIPGESEILKAAGADERELVKDLGASYIYPYAFDSTSRRIRRGSFRLPEARKILLG